MMNFWISSSKVIVFFAILGIFFACGGKKHAQHEEIDKELAALYQKIDRSPKDAKLYLQLSSYFLDKGLLDSALNASLVALKLDSNNSDIYLQVADIYFAKRDLTSVEEVLKKAIALDKNNNDARLKLSEFYFLVRDYEQSENLLIETIKLLPYNPKAYHLLGMNYQEENDTVNAIKAYLMALEQDADYFEACENLGVLYAQNLNPLAIDHYKNALRIRPDDPQILYNIAMFYQESGNYDQAVEYYKKMLQLNRKNQFALHNIGWIYLQTNRFREAVTFFTQAIEIDTIYTAAIFNRGLAFESLKDYSKARQDYMYTLRWSENDPLAIEALNRLDSLQKKK